jgi:rhodanese-related sulfurtransferase
MRLPYENPFQRRVEEARKRVREVSPEEAKEALDQDETAILVDVREPHEWARGHVPGVLHVPLGRLQSQADPGSSAANPALTSGQETLVIAYCARGERSLIAADTLRQLGYRNAVSMRGGFVDWARRGYPVE